MSTKQLFGILIVLASLSLACKGESPIAPSKPGVDPQPAPGTEVASFPLPGATEPLRVWITRFGPAKESQLTDGQTLTVSITCGGPSGGYEAVLDADFISDPSDPLPQHSIGALVPVSLKCNGEMTTTFKAYKGMPDKKYIRIVGWMAKAPGLEGPQAALRPPDAHLDQWVGYKSPQ
ncbi:MAG: hypothetical protein ACM3NH_04190 [Candidatus Saccharibacteria bacterium]